MENNKKNRQEIINKLILNNLKYDYFISKNELINLSCELLKLLAQPQEKEK